MPLCYVVATSVLYYLGWSERLCENEGASETAVGGALGAKPAISGNIGYAYGHGLSQWLLAAAGESVSVGRVGTAVACHSSVNTHIHAFWEDRAGKTLKCATSAGF